MDCKYYCQMYNMKSNTGSGFCNLVSRHCACCGDSGMCSFPVEAGQEAKDREQDNRIQEALGK